MMTPAAILALPAGPALDALVLERVCGWTKRGDDVAFPGWWHDPAEPDHATNPNHAPAVSTDHAAFWAHVVPAMQRDWGAIIVSWNLNHNAWTVRLGVRFGNEGIAPTVPLAGCRAALLAVSHGRDMAGVSHEGDT